jgi:hypothetical protein
VPQGTGAPTTIEKSLSQTATSYDQRNRDPGPRNSSASTVAEINYRSASSSPSSTQNFTDPSKDRSTSTMQSRYVVSVLDDHRKFTSYSEFSSKSFSLSTRINLYSNNVNRKRGVRFAPVNHENVAYTVARTEMTIDEINASWWSRSEHECTLRRASKLSTLDCAKVKHLIERTLNEAFDVAFKISSTSMGNDASQDLQKVNTSVSKLMNTWMVYCHSRRGLEKRVITHQQAKMIIGIHRKAVLSSSRAKHSPEAVRTVSCKTSATSRVYARMTGKADAFYATYCRVCRT